MITRIEAMGFRCLKYICQDLAAFQVLIGPNASGKTTFLDVLGFVGDILSLGLQAAIENRGNDFIDMTWNHEPRNVELVVEAEIPRTFRDRLVRPFTHFRYELRLGIVPVLNEVGILAENGWLIERTKKEKCLEQPLLFPADRGPPETLLTRSGKTRKRVLSKSPSGNDTFYSETAKGWVPSFKLGPRRSALANLPEDESRFPVATWFKRLMMTGVQKITLNSMALRKPSPAVEASGFATDGSNLPWIIHTLEDEQNASQYKWWLAHIRTALPEVESIRTAERAEDRSRYLLIRYKSGLEVPSWMASDGTLRLLALTVPAYVPNFSGICLIEEPENGVHPRAIETIFQSLSSVYGAQFLMATHSPTVLSLASPESILCFKKTSIGATDIVRGDEHPAVKDWKGAVTLSELYAGGVL